eukprot:TRINITY_DN8437_c0_g1_i3.p2 TRINITY_DN8437_c0_g1~~TRINITY_DN8437_c0_g1_i3.p2  ORF type:complete len:126 (-),score=4.92 TRINITY_DN8437_c0_g1_i3:120-497(-)
MRTHASFQDNLGATSYSKANKYLDRGDVTPTDSLRMTKTNFDKVHEGSIVLDYNQDIIKVHGPINSADNSRREVEQMPQEDPEPQHKKATMPPQIISSPANIIRDEHRIVVPRNRIFNAPVITPL